MSDVPPASANGRFPLPRCSRVAVAAVAPPDTDQASRPVWTDVIPLGDDRVGMVVADAGHDAVPVAQLRRLVAEALGGERSPARALEALDECVSRRPGPPVDGRAVRRARRSRRHAALVRGRSARAPGRRPGRRAPPGRR